MTGTVRRTVLEVWITPAPTDEEPDPVPTLDPTAFAVSCSFGFDQRYGEATIRRTGGGTIGIGYWSPVEIKLSCYPGYAPEEDGLETRFRGYVVPIDNALYPIENVLHCKGRLYRAAWVKNNQTGGTAMVPLGPGGRTDESMVVEVLTACGVPFNPDSIEGTGKALGSLFFDRDNVLPPGPFTWAEGESGLDFIERLDEVSVRDTDPVTGPWGRYRTRETPRGIVLRTVYKTVPSTGPAASFTEGVDVLEARITRDPAGAANRITVTGSPVPLHINVGGDDDEVVLGTEARFTVTSAFAPYLPPGLPAGPGTISEEYPTGFPVVTLSFSSPLIEKSTMADPAYPEDVISCQAVADFLLTEHNTVLDVLEFSTPRDDDIQPGETVHLDSPRLGLTDPDRHYWVQHVEITLDERGAFTQRFSCWRRS